MENGSVSAGQGKNQHGLRSFYRGALVVAVAVVVGIVAIGSVRQSAGPAQGTAFQGKAPEAASSPRKVLRVATYNIHGGRDARGHGSLAGIAECLRGADIIALNEVHGGLGGHQGNQAMILGEQLGLSWLFAPHERRWWRDHIGNGCLTSLPVTHWQRIPLAGPQRGRERNVVWIQLGYQEQVIQVLVTHLDRQTDRDAQLKSVARLFLALSEPCLLLGDLNTGENDATLQTLMSTHGVRDPVGDFLGPATPPRIDWILARGLRGLRASVCDHGASDHPCFVTDLEVASGF
jgi:endonuclease/exonuclease/phosphatase family metal-dependent hydrolase